MTRLLVSVRSADEARLALEAGVDLIDVKEPSRGSLGRADAEVIAEVVQAVAGRVPVSAALGELYPGGAEPVTLPANTWRLLGSLTARQNHDDAEPSGTGLNLVKLGLAGAANFPDWRSDWGRALAAGPADCEPVAVLYADWRPAASPAPEAVIDGAARLGCRRLLIDTYSKSGAGLFELVPIESLLEWMELARRAGLGLVLAGSLRAETIPRACRLRPDYVAVRGAACEGDRSGALSAVRLRHLVALVSAERARPEGRDCGALSPVNLR